MANIFSAEILNEIKHLFSWEFCRIYVHLNHNKNPQILVKSQEYMFIEHAVNVSRRILPAYSSKFSKYKQYQLFVILLYKVWKNVSYRDVIEMISSNPAFIDLLSISELPHFTTIQKFTELV